MTEIESLELISNFHRKWYFCIICTVKHVVSDKTLHWLWIKNDWK